jgi:phosphoribosylaminoimidazolecarboxamide formyltransferase/IMP cyclohydrolase
MPEGVVNLANAKPLQGKELSYNNLLDADAALRGVLEFTENPACVIVKHLSPCGVAVGKNAFDAYSKALEADSLSAFGGVVAINQEVDEALAKQMNNHFLEIIVAPSFTSKALEIFSQKPALRVVSIPHMTLPTPKQFRDMRSILGGFVVQDLDTSKMNASDVKVVTKRIPTDEELENLLFAWKCVKTVKSNAIVLAKNGETVGIGGGLTSRVDASELAVKKAGEKAIGAVAASDAFFPFADGPESLGKAGITAIIQPGGSKNDQLVIDACDAMGIAMVFTGTRVFRH